MRLTLRRSARQPAPEAYEREHSWPDTGEWIEHLDGIEWAYAIVPPRLHKCWPQTRAFMRPQPSMRRELVERCACGSLRFDGYGPWINRNTSKQETEQARADRLRRRDHNKAVGKLIEEHEAADLAEDWPRCKEIRAELCAAMEANRE